MATECCMTLPNICIINFADFINYAVMMGGVLHKKYLRVFIPFKVHMCKDSNLLS